MKQHDAHTAGHMALAAARRRARSVQLGGLGRGMYPCVWRSGTGRVDTITTAIFANATSHKAWRPKESSP